MSLKFLGCPRASDDLVLVRVLGPGLKDTDAASRRLVNERDALNFRKPLWAGGTNFEESGYDVCLECDFGLEESKEDRGKLSELLVSVTDEDVSFGSSSISRLRRAGHRYSMIRCPTFPSI